VGWLSLRSEGWRYDTRITVLDNTLCWVVWLTRTLTDPKGALLNATLPGNAEKLHAMRSVGMLGGDSEGAVGLWRKLLAKYEVEHKTVTVTEHCSLELHTPAGASGSLPVILWFHGGGHCVGTGKDAGMEVALEAFKGVAIVASVSYRMGPEAPYPAAAEDTIAALKYVSEHAKELGATADISVAGLSAGGNLAAVAAHNAAELGIDVKCAMLFVPEMTTNDVSWSWVENASVQALPAEVMIAWLQGYLPDRKLALEPNASPLFVEKSVLAKLAGKCSFVVHTASCDILRDCGVEYVDKLRAAGVTVAHVMARSSHSFSLLVDAKAKAQSVEAWKAAFLK